MVKALVMGAALIGSAVAAGVYVNFSARVMPRLAELPVAEAVVTMQRFNTNAVQWPFMTAFFGGAAASVALVVGNVAQRGWSVASALSVVGASLYLAGFVLTIVYNVPRNSLLAEANPLAPETADLWARYQRQWTAANTVRAVLSVGAVLALGGALLLRRT